MIKYLLNVDVVYKSFLEHDEIINEEFNVLNDAIKTGVDFIKDFSSKYFDEDEILYLDNIINNNEIMYKFTIYCFDQNRDYILSATSNHLNNIQKEYIYNKYIITNNLFESFLSVCNTTLHIDHNGHPVECLWNYDYIEYLPLLNNQDPNYYKYDNNTIVEYNGGVYIILGRSIDFDPKTILESSYGVDIYHSYSMYGINNGIYNHIRADDFVYDDLLSTDISDDNKYIIPFLKEMDKILDSSLDDEFTIIDDLVTKKYYYFLATGEIKYDL